VVVVKEVVVVVLSKMNGVMRELQQQVARKTSVASPTVVEDQLEPQLSNPTKERVKGPMGRRLPSKKVQGTTNKAINEEEEKEVTAALREFRTAAKRVREARDLDEAEEKKYGAEEKKYEAEEKKYGAEEKKYEAEEKKDEVSSCDMSRQGVVDPADFDRAWFFRVPSFSCHTTTGKRPKSETIDTICENNNMSTNNNNNNNNRDSVVVPNSTNSEGELESKEPEPGSREGSSDVSEGSGKKRRFWKSREFNCNIL